MQPLRSISSQSWPVPTNDSRVHGFMETAMPDNMKVPQSCECLPELASANQRFQNARLHGNRNAIEYESNTHGGDMEICNRPCAEKAAHEQKITISYPRGGSRPPKGYDFLSARGRELLGNIARNTLTFDMGGQRREATPERKWYRYMQCTFHSDYSCSEVNKNMIYEIMIRYFPPSE